jgi:hypothetical protein
MMKHRLGLIKIIGDVCRHDLVCDVGDGLYNLLRDITN